MSQFFDPFNADKPLMMRCSCGRHDSEQAHQQALDAGAATQELQRRSQTAEFEA